METILFVAQFVLGGLITVAVLLQKSSSVGLGAYGGSNESVFGAKGADGFLVKVTAILGILFIINTVALAYVYSSGKQASVTDMVKKIPELPKTPESVPQAPQTQNR